MQPGRRSSPSPSTFLPYMAKFGLPVGFQEAQTLTKFQLSFDHAKLTEPHMVGSFAQAALRYRATAFRSGFVNWWPLFVNNLVESIKSGDVVVEPDEIDQLTCSANKLGGFIRSGGHARRRRVPHRSMPRCSICGRPASSWPWSPLGPAFRPGAILWRQAAALFQAKLAEADAMIEDASFLDNIGRGFMWATELGYFGDSAALIAAAISENIWEIVQTVLLIAGAQAIPGVNILVDLYLLFTIGTDVISAIIDLAGALKQAGQSDTVVEMQRASARLAVALLQDTMRVVLGFLGIKGTVALLERSVAKIRAANPSISHRDAVRQAVRERQTAGAGAGGPPAKAPAKAPATTQEPTVAAGPFARLGRRRPDVIHGHPRRDARDLHQMFRRPGRPWSTTACTRRCRRTSRHGARLLALIPGTRSRLGSPRSETRHSFICLPMPAPSRSSTRRCTRPRPTPASGAASARSSMRG